MKAALIFLLAMVGLPVITSAQQLMPSNVDVASVVTDRHDPSNVFAVVIDRPSLYKSKDGGQSWAPQSSPGLDCVILQCRAVAIDPTNSNHLLAASDFGIHHSMDAGQTWAATLGGDFKFVGFDPFRPQVVFAVTNDRLLFRSNDGGANWVFAATAPSDVISDIAFSPTQPTRAVLIAPSAIYESVDEGATWRLSTGSNKSDVSVGSASSADLSITVSASNTFSLMSPLSARFEVTNLGPDTAMGVRVFVQLPTNMPVPSVNYSMGGITPCSIGTTQAVCEIPKLDVNQMASVTANFGIPLQTPTGNVVLLSGSVESNEADSNLQNNAASTSSTWIPRLPAPAPPSDGGGSTNLSIIALLALLLSIRRLPKKFRVLVGRIGI